MTSKSAKFSSPKRSDTPLFNKLDDKDFENMCCSLLNYEPNIIHADLYYSKYEKQYGVDVLGELENGKIDVVSCKVRQKLEKTNLAKFSDEFLDHWETHWKSKNVRRFIIAVTVDLKHSTRQKQLETERVRFKEIGVEYVYWSNRQLQEKLRPHHGIASQFIGDSLANQICGNPSQLGITSTTDKSDVVNFALNLAVDDLRSAVQSEIDDKFQQCQALLTEGKFDEVITQILSLREDSVKWTSITSKQQARACRFEGHAFLCKSDLDLAIEKAQLADSINPAIKEPCLNTLITYQQSGAQTALDQMLEVNSKEGLQFKASLLIEAGEKSEAENILDGLISQDPNDSETNRLVALCHYIKGDIPSALSSSQCSVDLEPKSNLNLRTNAILKYISALSLVPSKHNLSWPNPIDFDLVKLDETSQANLQDAEEIFQNLVRLSHDKESIEEYQTWRLACLFNQFNRQDKAIENVNQLLTEKASHVGAIVWSNARGVQFNKEKSIKIIEQTLQYEPHRKDLVLAIASLYMSLGKNSKALKWLQNNLNRFNSTHEKSLLKNWIAQAKLGTGEPVTDTSSWPLGLQIGYELQNACNENDWNRVSEFIQTHSEHEDYHIWVINLCRSAALKDKWSLVYKYRTILQTIGTPTAIELLVFSEYHCNNGEVALNLVEKFLPNFPNSQISLPIKRIIRNVQLERGEIPQAIETAGQLAAETKDPDDKISLVEALLKKGDVSTALPHIDEISSSGNLNSNCALHFAQIAALESHDLARDIIRDNNLLNTITATQQGNLLSLLYKTGLESDAHKLLDETTQRKVSDSSFIKIENIDTVVQLMKKQQEAMQNYEELYCKAQLPVHCFTSFSNKNLADFYFSSLNSDEVTAHSKSIFINSGRNKDAQNLLDENHLIYADITALLTAFRLNCLDEILDGFNKLFIPQSIIPALLYLENNCSERLPVNIDNIHKISDALKSRKISILKNKEIEASKVLTEQIDYLDISSISNIFWVYEDDNLEVQNINNNDFKEINFKEVHHHLISKGVLENDPDKREQLNNLKNATDIGFKEDSYIGFDLTWMIRLIEENSFDQTLNNLRVLISQEDALTVHTQLEKYDSNRNLKNQISDLRKKLSLEIDNGRIHFIPYDQLSKESLENRSDTQREITPIEAPLFELLSLNKQQNGIIWSDDRAINTFTNANGNQIISIVDIFKILQLKNHISNKRYYELLFKLRSNGAMFIHFDAEEIINALQNAPLNDLTIVSTPTLKSLKRHVALTCLFEENLIIRQQENMPPEARTDDMFLLLNLLGIARKTISEIWLNSEFSSEQKKAWSLWIWNELRADQFNTLPLHQQNDDGTRYLVCMQIANLFCPISEMVANNAVDVNEYVSWIKIIAFGPFIQSQPETIPIIAEHIRNNFSIILNKVDEEIPNEEKKYLRAFVNQLVELLPEELLSVVLESDDFSTALGRKRISSIQIAEQNFDATEFWIAISKAAEFGSSEISPIEKGDSIKVTSRAPDKTHIFLFEDPINALIKEPLIKITSPYLSEQKSTILNNRYDMDLSESDANDYHLKLSSLSPEQRILEANDNLYKCLRYRYIVLADQIKGQARIDWKQITLPEPDELFRFLRFKKDQKKFDSNFEQALECLSSEFDLMEAFKRLSAFPSPLPLKFREKLLSQLENKSEDEFENLISGPSTPLLRFHLLSIAALQKEKSTLSLDINASISSVVNNYSETSDAFCSIIKWVEQEVNNRNDWKPLLQAHKLAFTWFHAEHLCRAFFTAGVNPLWIKETFDKAIINGDHRDDIQTQMNANQDASCPSYLTKEAILFYGICYLLSDEQIKNLNEQEIENLKSIFSNENNDNFPAHFITFSRNQSYDSLSSIFLENGEKLAQCLWGDNGKQLFSKTSVDAFQNEILNDEADKNNSSEFLRHLLILGPWRLAENNDKIIKTLVNRMLLNYENSNPEEILEYLSALTTILNWLNIDANRKELLQYFQSLSEHLGKQYANQKIITDQEVADLRTDIAFSLLNCLFSSCRSQSGLEATKLISNEIIDYIENWPELKSLAENSLRNIIDGVPVSWRTPLWKALWSVRINNNKTF